MKFKDHFSGHAVEYAKFRPHYPDELFEHLASISPRHQLAWDCAPGNGQAAVGLARHFEKVIATDASARQIESAEPDERISYLVAPAEGSGIDSASVDLILVAPSTALVRSRSVFYGGRASIERRRCVGDLELHGLEITPEIDMIIWNFIAKRPDPSGRLSVTWSKLTTRTSSFIPGTTARQFEMRTQWNLQQVLGYLRIWSATKVYRPVGF